MRRVLALGTLIAMLGAAAYACSNDTFTGGDASSDASDDPQAAFCAAEAKYIAYCNYDAACIQKNLLNCGSVFATINPALSAAYVTCINELQLPCGTDIFSSISSSCMQGQLENFINDSGALAKLGKDFCTMCDPSQQAQCEGSFAAPKGAGSLAALFTDPTIVSIDTSCTKDAGTTVTNDASACVTAFVACELTKAAQAGPPDLCADASAD